MFSRLLPQILLLIALLFAQLGGLTHGFSHLQNEQHRRNEQSQPADFHCDLCDEYAQIGSALHSPSPLFASPTSSVIHTLFFPASRFAFAFVAFAARAPPPSA